MQRRAVYEEMIASQGARTGQCRVMSLGSLCFLTAGEKKGRGFAATY